VIGELYLAGRNVARGYLNLEKMTAERFLDDPFVPGNRMYKSGDIGRWLPNGDIEFLGRNDDQVKVRGYRVELGEIEGALRNHLQIKEAVVLARDSAGVKDLWAYIVCEGELDIRT